MSVESEIAEQPMVLDRLLARPGWDDVAMRVAGRAREGVLTVARGSSDHAASFFGYFVWTHLARPAASFPPSVATLHEKRPLARDRIAIGISQSGESPDVVRGLEALRDGGAYALALTNDAGSSLARAADETVELGCGPEKAVAATKTFTASLAALVAIGARWAKRPELEGALDRLPGEAALALEVDVSEPAKTLAAAPGAFVLGRGPTLALAEEAALKLKEVARLRAEALSASEFLHGPLGSLEPGIPVLVVLPARDPLRRACLEVAEALRAKSATVVVAPAVAAELPDEVAAIPQAIVLQRLAVAVARARGVDPDQPRNLVKVTKTW
jgi:glucosamine--fructose-6-phosphate aminotransferase (isomerizing)